MFLESPPNIRLGVLDRRAGVFGEVHPAPPAFPLALISMDTARVAALGAVVVADDDPDMRQYVARTLMGMGFETVFEAADGTSAVRLAHNSSVALVVSDYVMPGMDGLAVCDALKADAETADIPFLLISGLVREAPACSNGFLPKPFNAASLRASVVRLMKLPG